MADLFGVTKQVITNWRSRKAGFPQPVVELKSGPVWSRDAVIGWAASENVVVVGTYVEDEDLALLLGEDRRRGIVAAIMNMKGGVGKSTLAANLGWYSAYEKNLRVLLIDLDPQFNLSQYILGIKGYEKLLDENALTIDALFAPTIPGAAAVDINDIVVKVQAWRDGSCIHLLPATLDLAWSVKNAPHKAHVLRDNLEDIKYNYDIVIIDCAPTESMLSHAAYLAADYIFVPVKPEFLSTIGLPLLLRSLEEFQKEHRTATPPAFGGIIFNDTGEKTEHDRSRTYVKQVADENDLQIFDNEISHSDSYPSGSRVGKPIFLTDNARSWKKDEFNRVAAEFIERLGL